MSWSWAPAQPASRPGAPSAHPLRERFIADNDVFDWDDLPATARTPKLKNLGLETTGIALDARPKSFSSAMAATYYGSCSVIRSP
jgi:hypothetical protein